MYVVSAELPQIVDIQPPNYAKRMFKLVAVVDGIATSVFDGTTRYRPFTTVHHEAHPDHRGGLYVYPTVEDCLRLEFTHFPANSWLDNSPKAIAAVLAW
jgi:hypothetical protein